ncbi:MAG: methyltransferase domain-containing protein, partial [Methylococcales bacterium]|nr:methyltransferase domain-containing protein [Methylococcales bacterium]
PVFCENLKKKFPAATVVNSLFEDLSLEKTYDFIVLGHVLEHVKDPVEVLKRIRPLLRRSGRLLAAVPNARSIHRQAAVMMGILDTEYTLNDMDIHHGHYRVYNPELFRNDFLKAGYSIEASGGYWLKPLSNKQLEEEWSAEMIEAFMKLGEQYPDIAGEIYMVASSPE